MRIGVTGTENERGGLARGGVTLPSMMVLLNAVLTDEQLIWMVREGVEGTLVDALLDMSLGAAAAYVQDSVNWRAAETGLRLRLIASNM
jgi:hypothetical protein